MTLEGPTGYVLLAFAACVVFILVIGSVVWMYSRQSARRRNEQAATRDVARRGNGS